MSDTPRVPSPDPARPVYPGGATVPYLVRELDYDDLPRLAGIDKGSENGFDYEHLEQVIQSRYAIGCVAVVQHGPAADPAAGGHASILDEREARPLRETAGFLVYLVSDTSSKRARKRGVLHLTLTAVRLAVAPAWRRRGLGRCLLGAAEGSLIRQFQAKNPAGYVRTRALVPESWLAAQLFLRGCGFRVPRRGGIVRAPFEFADDDGYDFERVRHWDASAGQPGAPGTPPAPGGKPPGKPA